MSSLIDVVRTRFLDAIRSVKPPGKWKVIVVDEHAQKLLAAVLKTYDVLEENVTAIDSMASYRQPQSLEAMYLLMPTTKNVDRIIADFSVVGGENTYAGGHLFFMDPLPEPLFNRLVSSPAEPHLKVLTDLFINFRAIEAQVFSLHMPHHFFSYYSPPPSTNAVPSCRARIEEDLRWTAKGLLNVLISLGENPLIRYYVPDRAPLGALANQAAPTPAARGGPNEGSGQWRGALANAASTSLSSSGGEGGGDDICKKLAMLLQKELDDYAKANPDFVKTSAPKAKPVLLITDRTMDVASPFVHEFTYQAMVNDLLPIEAGTRYRYKFQSSVGTFEDQTVTLSDADQIWTKIRHLHMQDGINTLMSDFNNFLEENAGFTGKGGASSVNDMKDMLASLPQFKEQREKFSLHLNMAQESMDLYESRHLDAVAKVEQSCATGTTAEGKTPKTLVEDMVPLLADQVLTGREKVRIIALYIMYRQGVPDEDKRRLFEHARLSLAEQDAVNSLVFLGMRILRTPADKDVKKMKQKPADDDYELSRFQPILKTVLEEHVAGKLDQTQFPYVRNAPGPVVAAAVAPPPSASLRSARPGWTKPPRPGGATSKEAKGRMLVFVMGGMTYSEMRTAYRLSQSLHKDILIGSTHIYTPNAFLDDLKALEHGGVGSRSVPNGLQSVELRGETRSFQAAYDLKYMTKDAPPPPRPTPTPQQSHAQGQNRVSANSSSMVHSSGPSPSQSSSSVRSSLADGRPDKEKKKKGFFRF